jgi:hypothetical protein
MPAPKRGKAPTNKRKPTKLADANKKTRQPATLEQAVEQRWTPAEGEDPRRYLESQLQYYVGVSAERMRQHTASMARELDDPDNNLRDRVELLKGLAEWKKIEIALARMVQDELHAQPPAQELPQPSDGEWLKGVRLALEHVEDQQEQRQPVEDAEMVDDDEEILPLEGVG